MDDDFAVGVGLEKAIAIQDELTPIGVVGVVGITTVYIDSRILH